MMLQPLTLTNSEWNQRKGLSGSLIFNGLGPLNNVGTRPCRASARR